jgi:branched-chain amino acid transport system permease protein
MTDTSSTTAGTIATAPAPPPAAPTGAPVKRGRASRPRRNPGMITEYRQDLRLHRTRAAQFGIVLMALIWLAAPMQLEDAWLGILNGVAIYAIGGIGLNLLTGYTGQVSLGSAFFMAVGAFTGVYMAKNGLPFLGIGALPFVLWLPLAAVAGGAIGALIGPVALRLQGNYLAIVTIALLFLGEHILTAWTAVSGGHRGTSARVPLTIGPLDFDKLSFLGTNYSRVQGRFWLLWALVALTAILAKNIVRSRPGRAMQAIRDRDIAAEVVGISLLRYKVGAFALSSGLAAASGALLATTVLNFINPEQFGSSAGLVLSIQFVAVIIIGGMGTIYGPVLGALVVGGLPQLIQKYSSSLPGLKQSQDGDGLITVASFNNALFGVLVIVFLLAEPLGLAGVWTRIKTYFKSWPFSY